ncbi:MAG TPA: TIGR03435 family protein [Bryobacteraceae bacterium]|nr:TIGR03435 family protein [Bryobacteraceae bacterium]
MRLAGMLASTILACGLGCAQDNGPSFEVASIRPAEPVTQARAIQAHAGATDPRLVTYLRIPMKSLLVLAFKAKLYELAAPDWADREVYEIHATIPEGASREQLDAMMRNLLVERFGLQFHREHRQMSAYELVVAKGGLKMRESGPSTGDGPVTVDRGSGPVLAMSKDKDGLSQLPPGRKGMIVFGVGPGKLRYTARMQDMKGIVMMCENNTHEPVIDKTGLTGTYDFNLDFSRGGSPAPAGSAPLADAPESAPPFEVAIESLGLRLQSVKTQIEVVVVDRLNKVASEN